MKQGLTIAAASAIVLALGFGLALEAAAPAPALAAGVSGAVRAAAQPAEKKPSKSLRQFTGWVISVDAKSLTVEKRGKKPRTMTFVKRDEMRTTGEVGKDARVTVYYREEGGRAVAHRVVVKPDVEGSTSKR